MQAERKRYAKDRNPSAADEITRLIQLVRQNPALYNYKMQPSQRRRSDVNRGWERVALEMGDKYTLDECRRKWKNLRDTYHQYRLRKPKINDGLKKWRYSKDLSFLSDVYQPKLKSERPKYKLLHSGHSQNESIDQDDSKFDLMNNSTDDGNTVNEEEEFIIHAYETVQGQLSTVDDSIEVNDDQCMQIEMCEDEVDQSGHEAADDVENVVDRHQVKDENMQSTDNDGVIDYEEVCLYEESDGKPETTKDFQYIDTAQFSVTEVISDVTSDQLALEQQPQQHLHQQQLPQQHVFKAAVPIASGNNQLIHFHESNSQTKDELDLFFDFLKNKMQRLSPVDITAIQIEFLNCVLRREAENAQKSNGAIIMTTNQSCAS